MRFKIATIWLMVIPLSLSALPESCASGATPPNEVQVEQLVTAAIDLRTTLPTFSPSLASVSTSGGQYAAQGSSLSFNCDPERSGRLAKHPKPCWYGDQTSKRVVVLFGDSNAGNWTPALNLALKQLGYKLAVFVYPGCSSQLIAMTSGPGETESSVQRCNLYHSKVVSAIKELHPVALISAELGEGFSGKASSFLSFAKNWKSTFNELTANNPRAIRILMGTTPVNIGGSVPVCLSRFVSSSTNEGMKQCSPNYFPGVNFATNTWSYWQRDQLSASVSHAHLIPTSKWFCGFTSTIEDYCPAVIDTTLVYVDSDHISIEYMDLLQGVVREGLVSVGLKVVA